MTVSPAAIGLPTGISLTEAAQSAAIKRCTVGAFCSEHTELEIPESIDKSICCCCRAGTRRHA
jgi:hypothetical protein